jgi:hypothetical protein
MVEEVIYCSHISGEQSFKDKAVQLLDDYGLTFGRPILLFTNLACKVYNFEDYGGPTESDIRFYKQDNSLAGIVDEAIPEDLIRDVRKESLVLYTNRETMGRFIEAFNRQKQGYIFHELQ